MQLNSQLIYFRKKIDLERYEYSGHKCQGEEDMMCLPKVFLIVTPVYYFVALSNV